MELNIFFSVVLLCMFSRNILALRELYMEQLCNQQINFLALNEDAILLRVSPQAYRRNLDCIVAIEPHPNKQLSVKLQNLDIDALPSGQCTDDYLTLYDGRTQAAQFLAGAPNQICGNRNVRTIPLADSYTTQRGYLTARFRSGPTNSIHRGFDMIISAFHLAPCKDNEYKCYNQRCIPENLRCSGFDHCGDRTPVCLLTNEAKAAVGVTAILILIAIIVIVAVCVWRKKRQTTFNDRVKQQKQRNHFEHSVAGESFKVKMNGQVH
ncbi:low-density lipoprotein receptor-related protein 12-like isoform X1 [Mytilus edulis]